MTNENKKLFDKVSETTNTIEDSVSTICQMFEDGVIESETATVQLLRNVCSLLALNNYALCAMRSEGKSK